MVDWELHRNEPGADSQGLSLGWPDDPIITRRQPALTEEALRAAFGATDDSGGAEPWAGLVADDTARWAALSGDTARWAALGIDGIPMSDDAGSGPAEDGPAAPRAERGDEAQTLNGGEPPRTARVAAVAAQQAPTVGQPRRRGMLGPLVAETAAPATALEPSPIASPAPATTTEVVSPATAAPATTAAEVPSLEPPAMAPVKSASEVMPPASPTSVTTDPKPASAAPSARSHPVPTTPRVGRPNGSPLPSLNAPRVAPRRIASPPPPPPPSGTAGLLDALPPAPPLPLVPTWKASPAHPPVAAPPPVSPAQTPRSPRSHASVSSALAHVLVPSPPAAAPSLPDGVPVLRRRPVETAALWFAATVLPALAVGLAILLVTHVGGSATPAVPGTGAAAIPAPVRTRSPSHAPLPAVGPAVARHAAAQPAPTPAAPVPSVAHPADSAPARVPADPAAPPPVAPADPAAPPTSRHGAFAGATTPVAATPRERRAASDAIVAQAEGLARAGRVPAAEAAYAKAWKVCDQNPHAAAGLASLLLRAHDAGRALTWAQRAVHLRRHRARYFVIEGDALWLVGRAAEAQEAFATALALDPSDRQARARLQGQGPS